MRSFATRPPLAASAITKHDENGIRFSRHPGHYPGFVIFEKADFITLGGVRRAVGGGHDQTDQVGKRGHTGPLHHGGSMVLDGALTDAEVVSDDLVRTSLNDEVHDVAFAGR